MKAGVETGDLRHAGKTLGHGVNRREIVRLMERRQRDEIAQVGENVAE